MSLIEQNISIQMIRPNLDNLPIYPLPKPFTLGTYQVGDERAC